LGGADAAAAVLRTIAAASASSILIDIFASWDATAHGRKRMRRSFMVLAATLILSTAFSAVVGAAAPVKIAIVSRTVFYVPLWIADRLGYFKAEGIEPTIDVYDNAEKINEGLRSGRVRIAISTPESVVVDAYRGGGSSLNGT
jgi:ABC-type nitrate/sulfonate/bicarbonate transport system substrate-binding protein